MTKRWIAVLAVAALAAVSCGGSDPEPLSPAQAGEYFTNIEALLEAAVAEHELGDAQAAAELAGEAYLENFEHLEHDLEAADHDLNERLEGLLGPGLRREIQQGMSQEDLEARIDEARELLEKAKAALGVA